MKELKLYIKETLGNKTINEGPGSGVSMDFTGNLKYSIDINKGKAVMDKWELSDCKGKVSSYSYNFTIDDAVDVLTFKVAGVNPIRKGYTLHVNNRNVTNLMGPVLSKTLYSLVYEKDDYEKLKEEYPELTDETTVAEASKMFTISIYYENQIEITNMSLNNGGYTTRHIDTKTVIYDRNSDFGMYDTERCEADGTDLSFINDPKPVRDALDSAIMPYDIRPDKRLVEIYESIYFNDVNDPEDEYELDDILTNWMNDFNITFI